MSIPTSPDLERGLLGCLLSEPAAAVSEFIADYPAAAKLFWDERHRQVFEIMAGMVDTGKPVDQVTLCAAAEHLKLIEACGGLSYIAEVFNGATTAGNVKYYAEQLQNLHYDRELIACGQRLVALGSERRGREALDEAEADVLSIGMNAKPADDPPVKELVRAAVNRIEDRMTRRGGIDGILTGLFDLDCKLRGLKPGQLVILAARPSKGKTSLALNIAERAAVDDRLGVGVFSLEMTREDLVERMIASRAGVALHALHADTPDAVKGRAAASIATASVEIAKAKLKINDRSAMTITTLRAEARRLVNRHKLHLLIVDYLQLMQGTARKENRTQEVSEISRGLKALALELKIPIVALSQLNRSSEADAREPRLSDLRESGSIEQDADIVVFIHDPETDDSKEPREVQLLIRKHRNGPCGRVAAQFARSIFRFRNAARK